MKNNSKIQALFNFLSKPAKQDFTLGRVVISTFGSPMDDYRDHHFKRGGRIIERSITIGATFAAVATGVASGFLPAVGALAIAKCVGLAAGYATDEGIKSINNKINKNKP